MTAAFIAPTDIIIAGMIQFQQDEHCKARRHHAYLLAGNPNYMQEIAARQAMKRAAGIGPEGRCTQ